MPEFGTPPLKSVEMNAEDIMAFIPHRPPMLMLDKVTALNECEILTETFLPAGAFFFQGHFPNKPILPGIIMVEAIAQAGALLAALSGHFDSEHSLLAFGGIDKAKFKRSVYPNETLCVHTKIVKQRNILYKFEGRAKVNDAVVAIVNFSATKIPK